MANVGATQRQIARTFNCSQTTISKLIIRYQQTGQTQDRPRSGRPRVTTPADDRYIRQIHLRNRPVTEMLTAETALGHAISRRTVLRRLRTAGIRAYRPFRGMALTRLHCQRRLQWARTVRAGVCAFNICEGRRCLETRAGKTACVKGGHNQAQRQTTVITTLIDACTVGDLPKVTYILSQDIANLNKSGKNGMTPAMIAAQKGHREILELLVKKGADLCLLDDDDNTILHVACKEGNVEIVKYIHSQNIIDTESRGDYGNTPVMFAALYRQMEVFFFLVKMGAHLSKLDDDGENILHLSSRGGDVEIVNCILKRNVVDINSEGDDGVTPLMLAAYFRRRQVFYLLIERGANTSAVDCDNDNILHYSCRGGDVEIVNYVLTHKIVNINSRTNALETPVLVAALRGKTKVFQLLIERGADIAKTHDRTKLLKFACKIGDANIVKRVLNLAKVDIAVCSTLGAH
ncbi:putative ankyrin repeat protein RF_0381 [Haliotis rufescens]|uniref:putative ankyrin repeat protein RF_0381 n=1 Tax=Haliotis rufescens TaxID=6454 RepID=UPI00201F641D|nr:putative ankyrin repeat protein RF_0381 [Haliotis rufescens]